MASSSTDNTETANVSESGETMDTDNGNAEEQQEELFPGCTSITEFSQRMLRSVVGATKTSNALPTGDDYDYYSTYDSVRNVMDMEARRLLTLLQGVMRHHNVKGTISGTSHALELDEQFDVIMDANDQILERVATQVDEATGVRKNEQKLVVTALNRPNPAVASWNKKRTGSGGSVPVQLLTAKNIQRPQLSFRDKVDNSNKPFVPVIRHKPHAKQSLQESLQLPQGMTLEDTESHDFVYPHPYQRELDEWQPSPEQLETVTPQEPQPVDDVVPQFIDTVSDLAELCDLLSKQKEIAVDLEHHSYRTFQGMVCLMQISTRSHDYLLDTLALRADMSMLNQVFADPSITKVFHGADSDIEWLQRDFGVYVVNMFDTGQAARVLGCARYSLAHLLHSYCQVEADKQYQLSDWRMRPLHEKMVRYAQEDTHYLLYIYDRMRNELIERGNEQRNLLQSVYQRSKLVCLKVYKKPQLTAESHHDLYLKSKKLFNSQQIFALRGIYAWRDQTAREEDESVQYVLPNHMLLQIAEILPRERQGVLACCNPIPPLVRQCQHDIHAIIMNARDTPLTQMEEKKPTVLEPSSHQHPQYHSSITACPHDLSKNSGDHGHLQASSTGSIAVKQGSSLLGDGTDLTLKPRPILSALGHLTNQIQKSARKTALKVVNSFDSPFARFLPLTEGMDHDGIVKPKTEAKVWRLKQHTGSGPNKRKSDVDLNTFAPEFAPPKKRKNAKAETPKTAAAATSKTPSQPPSSVSPSSPPPSATTTSAESPVTPATTSTTPAGPEGKKKKKKEKANEEEGEEPLSSRQMMKKKKKEKKKAAKEQQAALAATATETAAGKSPATIIVPSLFATPTQGAALRKPTPTLTPALASEEQKKKKKKKDKSVSFTVEETEPVGQSAAGKEGEGEEETKKKKKKKKGNVMDVAPSTEEKEEGEVEEETKKKKKKKKENLTGAVEGVAPSTESKEGEGEEEETKKKKKKKKGKNSSTILGAASELVSSASSTTTAATGKNKGEDNEGEETKKKKKKRKKKAGGVGAQGEGGEEEGEVEITPFDYSLADKSGVTGKVKQKDKGDVYSPHFRADKRKKKGKKERFGAKQKKSMTFAAAGAGGKGKH